MKKNSKSMLKTEGRNLDLKSKSISLNENNKLSKLHVSASKNLSVLDSSKKDNDLPTAKMAVSRRKKEGSIFDEDILPEVTANVAEGEETEVTANKAESEETEVTANMTESEQIIDIGIEKNQENTDYSNKIENLENYLKVKKTVKPSDSVKEDSREKSDEKPHFVTKKQHVKPFTSVIDKDLKNSTNNTNSAIKLPVIKKKSLIVNQNIDDVDENIIKEETGSGGLSGTISENEDIEGIPDIEKKLKIAGKDNYFGTLYEDEDNEEISDIEKKIKVVEEDNKKHSNEIIRKKKFNTNLKAKESKNNKPNEKKSIKGSKKGSKNDKSNKISEFIDKIPFVKKYMYIRKTLKTLKTLESDRFIENILLKIFSFFVSVIVGFFMNMLISFCLFFVITIAVIGMLVGVISITVVALVTIFSFIFGVFFGSYQVDTKSPNYLTNYTRTEIHSDFISNCQIYTKNPELYHVVYARLDENGQLCDVGSGTITETDALEKAYLAKMYAENHESATDADALNQYLIIDTDEEKKVLKEIHDKMFFIEVTDIYFNEVLNGKQVKRRLVRIYGLTLKNYLARYGNEISSSERTYIEDFARYE